MGVYYNEFDPKVAAWLKQLIKNGDIADGEVDERSIADVEASDLRGFTQHHFFAGIGTWSYALRSAGWSEDRPVCTASLPCQPFSATGNQKGKEDERHLLPRFLDLVRQCRFDTIIGEQVPRAIKHGWLDDLYDEMERENYTVGSVVLTAAGAGKAHIRQRLYWVANAKNRDGWREPQQPASVGGEARVELGRSSEEDGMAYSSGEGLQRHGKPGQCGVQKQEGRQGEVRHCATSSLVSGMGRPSSDRPQSRSEAAETSRHGSSTDSASGVDWIYCGDEKYRPIKSSIAPLVNGVARGVVYSGGAIDPNNTGLAKSIRIKGYGNAIVAPLATQFISAIMEII